MWITGFNIKLFLSNSNKAFKIVVWYFNWFESITGKIKISSSSHTRKEVEGWILGLNYYKGRKYENDIWNVMSVIAVGVFLSIAVFDPQIPGKHQNSNKE